MKRLVPLALAAILGSGAAAPHAAAPSEITLLDAVETDFAYSTVTSQFYERVPVARILAGAHDGMVAYLRSRGVAKPIVGMPHAQADGRFAVPAIEQQIAFAIIRYPKLVEPRDLVYAVIRGEVAALHDPYAVFFTAKELATFSRALDGTAFGGIGASLVRDDAANVWRIDEVFPNSPAAKAGLTSGDVVAQVDGVPLDDRTADAAGAHLRGTIGTTVHLTIVRDGAALPAPLALVRASITPPATTAKLLPGNVGYVALRSFDARAGDEVRAAVRGLAKRGARAFVFDLRDNGGGYESAAVSVASQFVASGPIVILEDRHGHRTTTYAKGNVATTAPLVVLVNGDSASGSELATGAIQDAKRGIVVGTGTFGKGVEQSVIPMPDGAAIKLTTARYFTGRGRNIEKVGLTPDVVVAEPDGSAIAVPGKDPQLDRALAILARTKPPGAAASPAAAQTTPLPGPSAPSASQRR
jgi:carboxyl-terminal processing protease